MLPESENRVEGDPQIFDRPPHPDPDSSRRQCQFVGKLIPRTVESARFRFWQRHPQSDAADDLHRRKKLRLHAFANLGSLVTGREQIMEQPSGRTVRARTQR